MYGEAALGHLSSAENVRCRNNDWLDRGAVLIFTFVYAVLGAAVVYVLLYYFRKHPVDEDLNTAES